MPSASSSTRPPLRGVDASPYSYEYRREYSKAPTVPEETLAPAGVDGDVTGGVDDLVTEPRASGPAGTTGLTPTR